MALRAVPSLAPPPGRWTWESARGNTRAVRVSAHPQLQAVNLSVWRTDRCVGSVHLSPAEAAALIGKLTDALAELATGTAVEDAAAGSDVDARVAALEARLTVLEQNPTTGPVCT